MAVTFVIGNTFKWSGSLFSPGNSIASASSNSMKRAASRSRPLLELGLILFSITTIVLKNKPRSTGRLLGQ